MVYVLGPPYYDFPSYGPVLECFFLQMGITNETHVVIYDNHTKFGFYSGGRVWWMFKVHVQYMNTYIHIHTIHSYIHVNAITATY